MTPRQKRIIGALAIANAAAILTLSVFVARFSPATSATPLPSPTPPHPSASPTSRNFSATCQRRAVELLSQSGIGGTAAVTPGRTLQLDLVYRIPQDQATEEAAQQVWTAFDIAQMLNRHPCDTFSHVTVVIQAQGAQSATQIHASVDATDLAAFYNGELGESAFIDRVQYEAQTVDTQ